MDRIDRILGRIALPVWLAFFGVEAFMGHVPLWACWLALFVVEAWLFRGQWARRRYHLGHAGTLFALVAFGGVGAFLGFDATFPSSGTFFYGGYALAFFLQGAVFRWPRYEKGAGPWMILVGGLYAAACAISLLLAPHPASLYVPPLVAVVPGIVIAIRVGKAYERRPPKEDARVSNPWGPRIMVGSVLAIAVSIPWIAADRAGVEALTLQERALLDTLDARPSESLDAAEWQTLGRLRFLSGSTLDSRRCFEEVLRRRAGDPVPSAYLAALVAIKARDGLNPILRMKWANEAAKTLDSLLVEHPEQEEVRLIRASVYSGYPASFHKQDTVRSDVAKLERSRIASIAAEAKKIGRKLTAD